MPNRRPKTVPDVKIMVDQFERTIKGLVDRFRKYPYIFYTETDMHCYLYYRLYTSGIFNGLYKTKEGYDTILLHKEYPTLAKYQRQVDKKLKQDPRARKRGHFDICIWNPENIWQSEHRKQKVLIAAELALNECGSKSIHTINDLTNKPRAISIRNVNYLIAHNLKFDEKILSADTSTCLNAWFFLSFHLAHYVYLRFDIFKKSF